MYKAFLILMAFVASITVASTPARADQLDEEINAIAGNPPAPADESADKDDKDLSGLSGTDRFIETMNEMAEDSVAKKPAKRKPAPTVVADAPKPPPKSENVEFLNDNASTLKIDNELNEVDAASFDDVTTQASNESASLRKEIKSLEKQLRSTKNVAERAKKKSFLAQKRLELQTQLEKEAQARLKKAESSKKKQESELARLQARVKATEDKAAKAKAKTKETQDSLQAANKERTELERRLKKALAQIEQEKKREKALRLKRQKLAEKNKTIKKQAQKAEKRVQASRG